MPKVEKKRMGIMILGIIVVVLLVSNVFFYLKISSLQNSLGSASAQNEDYRNIIEGLLEDIEDLKQPKFYTTQLNWSVYEEAFGQFRIEVEGIVFNAGVYGATYVVAYPHFKTAPSSYLSGITPENFTISNYLLNGVFEEKTFREFSETFYTDNFGVQNMVEIEITYEFSTTV